MNHLILAVILSLIFVNQGWAAQRYFSQSTGDDGTVAVLNNCTHKSSPCKSIKKVNDIALSGDTISFKAGDTWNETDVIYLNFASQATYNSYGTGAKPVIQGSGSAYAASGNSAQGLTVDGLHFKNNKYAALYFVASWGAVENLTIKNCLIETTGTRTDTTSAFDMAGIYFYAGGNTDVKNHPYAGDIASSNIVIGGAPGQGNEIITTGTGVLYQTAHDGETDTLDISYNYIHDSFGPGIRIMGLWGDNPPYNSSGDTPPYGVNISHNTLANISNQAIWVQGGISYHTGRATTISYNTATNIGDTGIPNINAFQLNSLDTATVEHNIITTVRTSVGDGAGIAIDLSSNHYGIVDVSVSKNVIVQYNTVSGCRIVVTSNLSGFGKGIDIMAGTDCIVRYNIIYDNDAGLVQEFSFSKNNIFYNNVSYGNNIGAMEDAGDMVAQKSTWINNIVVHNKEKGMWWGGRSIQPDEWHNIFYDNQGCDKGTYIYGQYNCINVPTDATDILTDPLFVAPASQDFHLQSTSPAINAGINSVVSGIASLKDFAGNLVTDSSGTVLFRQINGKQLGNVDIGPYFFADNLSTLLINKGGTGGGIVTSSPAGINCGNVCSGMFPLGTKISLQALPDQNSTFTSWSGGGCSGAGSCTTTLNTNTNIFSAFTLLPPAADFSASPTSGLAPLTVNFTDQSLRANAWVWDFGDSSTSSLQNPSHTYAKAGTYSVTLQALGTSGNDTSTKNNYITVVAPVTLNLIINGSGGGIVDVTTTTDDIMCSRNCSVPFAPGTMVSLGATPDLNSGFTGWTGGCSGNSACTITINADTSVTAGFAMLPLVASFSAFPTTGVNSLTVNFTDNTVGASSWLWTFGDGNSSNLQNPSNTYNSTGTYSVSLKATNSSGSSTVTKNKLVTVTVADPKNPLKSVRIPRNPPVPYPTLQSAFSAVQNGEVIQSQAVEFTEALNFNRPVNIFLTGGFNGDFSTDTEISRVTGTLIITGGSLTVDRLVIK